MLSESSLADLYSYLRFPSVSADPGRRPAMQACADWLVRKFSSLGLDVQLHEAFGPPVVVARSSPEEAKPTVLIYGHYDVQPVDPLALWRHPPFEPVLENGLIVARGATDNKGQTMCHILGLEAWRQKSDSLPVNLIFLLEGEEEIGSPHLAAFLREHREALRCDVIVISDTSMVAPGFPAITCGLRGIACLDVEVTGPGMDLHSGMFGGAVANPATELIKLLARLHREDGSVAVPGFYDGVAPVLEQERAGWRNIDFGEKELLAATGSPRLAGEEGFSALERLWMRPTAEINGLTSGYQGEGSKTIVPQSATAKLSFRLVPDQKPEVVAQQVCAYLHSLCPDTVRLRIQYDHGGEPYYPEPGSAPVRAAHRALTEVFGRSPALVREGLSIPIVSLFQRFLGRDTLLIGLGLPDCQAHAPNETFPLVQLERGIELHQALLKHLAAM